ncbi:MAG: methylmalonyl Co-A mutase-associated GTPase MeaB [Bacteroidetes bacterium]|nr:methylmalonyl Co-A mutase-associated GTPase MeaB [Bacteroidota bacterium]
MMDKNHKSALSVMEGVEQPDQINAELVKKLKSKRAKPLMVKDYVDGVKQGNRTILSKAITLIESALPKDQELAQLIITECLRITNYEFTPGQYEEIRNPKSEIRNPKSEIRNPSIRIGITGVPGVGKSTFIEAIGKYLTALGHKLAVLAIDPSSSRSKGSILGDKTRMEELAVDPNAFIRPSPAAGSLGGVARKTRETIILCEAAGFDVIFIETVGVGQSETTVHSMVDFFLLLMLAGAGDELQGIKRGIIEMADAIFINKADGENLTKAKAARIEYANALHLYPPPESGWTPVADICSAKSKMGIEKVWETILEHRKITQKTGYFQLQRQLQNRQVLYESIESELRRKFFANPKISAQISEAEEEITLGRINPYQAAQKLLDEYFGMLL